MQGFDCDVGCYMVIKLRVMPEPHASRGQGRSLFLQTHLAHQVGLREAYLNFLPVRSSMPEYIAANHNPSIY